MTGDDKLMHKHCDVIKLDLSNGDLSKVIDMHGAFLYYRNAALINVSTLDTSNIIDMSGMFWGCSSLKEIDLSNFNTSKTTDISFMFNGCRSLTSLNLSNFDTSNATHMHAMFGYCELLTSLDLSSFDFSNVTDAIYMFDSCFSLTDIKFGKNLKTSIEFYNSPLSHESALSVIDGLAKVKEEQTIWFSDETVKLLTDEDKKKIAEKNWSLNKLDLHNIGYHREYEELDLSSYNTSDFTDMNNLFSSFEKLKK